MLRTGESETEILLGNKQLLGVFLVIALLLGAAFTGGYMVGRNTSARRGITADDTTASSPAKNPSAIETHSIPPEGGASGTRAESQESSPSSQTTRPRGSRGEETASQPAPLGARHTAAPVTSKESSAESQAAAEEFNPHSGQQFLQVAAVGRDEAEAIADVLHKKGFRAHAVPKPGSSKIYRVLIGPIRDSGDLSNTRDSLRRTGFREVIVQRY